MEHEHIFLKLGDIKGESTSDKFPDHMVLQICPMASAWEEKDRDGHSGLTRLLQTCPV